MERRAPRELHATLFAAHHLMTIYIVIGDVRVPVLISICRLTVCPEQRGVLPLRDYLTYLTRTFPRKQLLPGPPRNQNV